MLRTVRDFARLRQRCFYEAIRRVLVRYLEGEDFRVEHISIQTNHLHLLVEAANEKALSRGMQSFAIRAAREINRAWGREAHAIESNDVPTSDAARSFGARLH